MNYNFKHNIENGDCQKYINTIVKYGNDTERDVCSSLRTMTWNRHGTTPSAQKYLNNILREHVINIALSIKERNLDKDDWFMDF